jgi:GNAT superfamily N-acetyltransferase
VTVLAVGDRRIELRSAVERDLPALVALLADDPLGSGREARDSEDLAPYRRAFGLLADDPAHTLVVAVDGGEIVGTLQLSVLPGLSRRGALRGQIEAVRVRAGRRGEGLGAAMIAWAIEEAGRRSCALVQLTTDKSRADAHRFYRRLGFVPSHEGFKLELAAADSGGFPAARSAPPAGGTGLADS